MAKTASVARCQKWRNDEKHGKNSIFHFFLGLAWGMHYTLASEKVRKQSRKLGIEMAIFTRPKSQGGRDVVGCRIVCTYQGSSDPAPLNIDGMVKSQRKIEGKGNLLTVETADGFRSIYFEKATSVTFYSVRVAKNTDDGYDAHKDRMLTRYGTGWRKR